MSNRQLINLLFKLDALSFRYKQKLTSETHGLQVIWWAIIVVLVETVMFLLSLPLSFLITEKTLQANGAGEEQIQKYRLRRKISIFAILGLVLFWILKLLFSALIALWFIPATPVFANSAGWHFSDARDYIYDSSEIQIVDGMAVLKVDEETIKPADIRSEPTPTAKPSTPPIIPESSPTPSTKEEITIPVIQTEPADVVIPSSTPTPTTSPEATPVEEKPADPAPAEQSMKRSLWSKIHAAAPDPNKKCTASITPTTSQHIPNVQQWTGFEEIAEKNGGEIYYQLSNDNGNTWNAWIGNNWSQANSTNQRNTAAEVNSKITSFSTANNQIKFRAFLVGICSKEIKLMSVNIPYTLLSSSSAPSIEQSPSPAPSVQPSPSILPSVTPKASIISSPTPSPTPSPSLLPIQSPETSSSPTPSATPLPFPTQEPIPSAKSFTLSFWVVPSDLSGGQTITQQGTYFRAFINDLKTSVSISLLSNYENLETASAELPAEGMLSQYLVTMTYSNGSLKLYINGELLSATQVMLSQLLDDLITDPPASVSTSSHEVSQDEIVLQYLNNRNTPPEISQISSRLVEDKWLELSLMLADLQHDFVNLNVTEYQTPSTDEYRPMTLIPSGSLSTSALTSGPEGVIHKIVWDAQADLGTYTGPVTVKFVAQDSLEEGMTVYGTLSITLAPEPVASSTPSPSASPALASPDSVLNPSPSPVTEDISSPLPSGEEVILTTDPSSVAIVTSPSPDPTTAITSTFTDIIDTFTTYVTEVIPGLTVDLNPAGNAARSVAIIDQASSARESRLVPVPTVTSAEPLISSNAVKIQGQALPNAQVVIYIFSNQAVIYQSKANEQGLWEVIHDQNVVNLEPGVHKVYAQTILGASDIKSSPSLTQTFELQRNLLISVLHAIDLPTTISTIIVAIAGIILLAERRKVKYEKN